MASKQRIVQPQKSESPFLFCDVCTKNLDGTNPNYIKLEWGALSRDVCLECMEKLKQYADSHRVKEIDYFRNSV